MTAGSDTGAFQNNDFKINFSNAIFSDLKTFYWVLFCRATRIKVEISLDAGIVLMEVMRHDLCERISAYMNTLTHWGRMTHICVGKLTIIGSDNGLSPVRRQAIIWTSAGILLIGTLETNFSEILIAIEIFSFKKMHLKMSSVKWRPLCLGLKVLKYIETRLSLWTDICIAHILHNVLHPSKHVFLSQIFSWLVLTDFSHIFREYANFFGSFIPLPQCITVASHECHGV